MTQVFISYSHRNTDHLLKLVDYLKVHNIALWYDAQLEGGDDWRDEISEAIDESYALLIVVTEEAMQSHYCTYEWAYGLGTGMPVIPLIFEDINITDIHAPLRSKQFINCTETIPDILKNRLAGFQQEPIDVIYLRRKIMEAVMPFRILMHTVMWYRNLPRELRLKRHLPQDIEMRTRDESARLYFETLPELMTSRSHAFTTSLKRTTRLLIDELNQIHNALQSAVFDAQSKPSEQQRLFEAIYTDFHETLLPILEATTDHSELLAKYIAYLESIKTAKPDPFVKVDVQILLGLYLDDKDQDKLLRLVDSVVQILYRPKS